MLNSSAWSITVIQFVTTILAVIGLIFCDVHLINYVEIFIGYFLLSCIGLTIFYHRYLSHRSFKTNPILEKIGIMLGVIAGRGSPLGWVAVHRQHHRYADGENDPHPHSLNVFIPHKIDYKFNAFAVTDLVFSKFHRTIDDYYNLIIFLFVLGLGLISWKLLLFLWIIPAAMTAWALNLFVYLTHYYGYTNHSLLDRSTNSWFISLILWGEGWHNNHHDNSKLWNLRQKWWEIDLAAQVIKLIKT